MKNFDYSQNGIYFITICTQARRETLAYYDGQQLVLSSIGRLCKEEIEQLPLRYKIILDQYVIMPNHVHLLLRIEQVSEHSIIDVICSLKSVVTKKANLMQGMTGRSIWQRSYHDHVVRNESAYLKIGQYIEDNPRLWEEDCFHPAQEKKSGEASNG